MHPATTAVLRYFAWDHLPPDLQAVSKPIGELAQQMAETLPGGPELTTGLRKLLEAKDCLVRAALDARTPPLAQGGIVSPAPVPVALGDGGPETVVPIAPIVKG